MRLHPRLIRAAGEKEAVAHRAEWLHGQLFPDGGWSAREWMALCHNPVTELYWWGEPESDALPLGMVLLQRVGDEAEILTLGIQPAYRGCGQGLAMLQALQRMLQHQAVACLFLEVDVENTAALRLYERAGFQNVGKRAHYYTHPDGHCSDARVLRWNVDGMADVLTTTPR